MIRSPRSRVAPVAASFVAVLALGLAACGGDDDDAAGTAVTGATSAGTADTAGSDTAATVTAGTDVESSDVGSSTPGTGSVAAGEVGTEEEYVAAASEAIAWEDTDISDCVATALVDAITYDQIEEAGVTVEQFSEGNPSTLGLTVDESDADAVSSDVADCGDLIGQIAAANGMSDDEQSCITDNIDNGQMAELLVTQFFTFTASDDLNSASDDVDACITALEPATTLAS
jgi:hypothetical protein